MRTYTSCATRSALSGLAVPWTHDTCVIIRHKSFGYIKTCHSNKSNRTLFILGFWCKIGTSKDILGHIYHLKYNSVLFFPAGPEHDFLIWGNEIHRLQHLCQVYTKRWYTRQKSVVAVTVMSKRPLPFTTLSHCAILISISSCKTRYQIILRFLFGKTRFNLETSDMFLHAVISTTSVLLTSLYTMSAPKSRASSLMGRVPTRTIGASAAMLRKLSLPTAFEVIMLSLCDWSDGEKTWNTQIEKQLSNISEVVTWAHLCTKYKASLIRYN